MLPTFILNYQDIIEIPSFCFCSLTEYLAEATARKNCRRDLQAVWMRRYSGASLWHGSHAWRIWVVMGLKYSPSQDWSSDLPSRCSLRSCGRLPGSSRWECGLGCSPGAWPSHSQSSTCSVDIRRCYGRRLCRNQATSTWWICCCSMLLMTQNRFSLAWPCMESSLGWKISRRRYFHPSSS